MTGPVPQLQLIVPATHVATLQRVLRVAMAADEDLQADPAVHELVRAIGDFGTTGPATARQLPAEARQGPPSAPQVVDERGDAPDAGPTDPDEGTALLTLDEAAAKASISRRTLDRRIAADELDVVRLGPNSPRIIREDLEDYIARSTT